MIQIANDVAISGGIALCLFVVALGFWVVLREDKGRPILPWGARMSVERERAYAEREKHRLNRDATEIKRLALDHQRARVLAAIEADDHQAVAALGMPSSNGQVEEGQWSAR